MGKGERGEEGGREGEIDSLGRDTFHFLAFQYITDGDDLIG